MFWAILFGFVVVAFASGWCLLKGRHGIAICLALLMAGGGDGVGCRNAGAVR
jgi:hypothetical protein